MPTLTFTPVANAQVRGDQPTTVLANTGVDLRVDDGAPKNSYLRFDISGVPSGATITGAELTLVGTADVQDTVAVRIHSVADNTWSESTLTYNNAPTINSTVLDTENVGTNVTATFSIPSSALPSGNGLVSFGLTRTSSGSDSRVCSRTHGTTANRPSLVLTYVTANTVGPDAFAFTGEWVTAGPFNAAPEKTSGVTNSEAHIKATVAAGGGTVSLTGFKGAYKGYAGITVDGGIESTVSQYWSANRANVVFWTSGTLAAGTHTIVVRCTGTKETASNDVLVSITGATITNGTLEQPSPPPTNLPPTVSIASVSPITLPGTATLNGTVTDPESQPVTGSWSLFSGPGQVIFADPLSIDTTVSFETAGTYILQLTGSDGVNSDTAQVTITVQAAEDTRLADSIAHTEAALVALEADPAELGTAQEELDTALSLVDSLLAEGPANTAPDVSAGSDQAILVSEAATLDGTASDVNGDPVSVTWSKVSGPGDVSFGASTEVDTTAIFSATGTYVLRLTGSDGTASTSDDVTVTVNAVPVSTVTVSAGPDRSITLPAGATLDGTVSSGSTLLTDNFATADTSKWTFGSGQSVSGGHLVLTPTTAYPNMATPATYNVTGSALTFEVVTPPATAAPSTQAFYVALEDDNAIDSVTWLVEGTNLLAQRKSGPTTTTVQSGTYNPTSQRWLRISESGGVLTWSTSPDGSTWTTFGTWTYSGFSPAAAGVRIGAGYWGSETNVQNIELDNVSITSAGGGTLTGVWSKVSGPGTVTFGNANAIDTTATFSAAGVHVLRLTGSNGTVSDADDMQVSVAPAPVNNPPTVSAGPDAAVTLPSPATLNGTATDPEGQPLTVLWTRTSGPGTVQFANPNVRSTTATVSSAGTHVFRLTANDGVNTPVFDETTITVSAAPAPPGGTTFGIGASASYIASLPMSGAGWTNLLSQANATPQLLIADGATDWCGGAVAAALAYVRAPGTYGNLRTKVLNFLQQAQNTNPSAWWHAAANRKLGQLALAGELVGKDDTGWHNWLKSQMTAVHGGPGRSSVMITCAWDWPNNHGAAAHMSVAAVYAVLGIESETLAGNPAGLVPAMKWLKGFCGDRSSTGFPNIRSTNPSYSQGMGVGDIPESDTWQLNPNAPYGIVPDGTTKKNGSIPSDVCRTPAGLSSYPNAGSDGLDHYVAGNLTRRVGAAIFLSAALNDASVWTTGNSALRRARQWMVDYNATMDNPHSWGDPALNEVYGTSFAGTNIGGEQWLGGTQWLASGGGWPFH